ncbi:MAG: glycosyltransferase [Anaerolineae bacterium]|nr:glycosyltransferase [Anaerolineae bacterium]
MNVVRKVPKVSVLMAVYNGARYLREAVESILNQTFSDFEFIIVDDGSTDETPAILDGYHDSRIVRLRNAHNLGMARSLNRGLEVARGVYIARQDADDRSYPMRLERQVAFLDVHPEVGLLGTAYDVMDAQGCVVGRISPPIENATLQRMLVRHNCFGHGSVMMRRDRIEQAGHYEESFLAVGDYDLWLRLAEWTNLANLADPLYGWRRHEASITARYPGKRHEQLRIVSLQRMLARRPTPRPGVPGWAPEDLAAARVVLAVSAALLDERTTARQALAEAWQLAGAWLEDGGFVEVAEEAMGLRASEWAGWAPMPGLLQRLVDYLPDSTQICGLNELFARLYRHAAFEAHVCHQPQQVRRAAWAYWRRRPLALFTDRGMASIWLQSWRGGIRA